MKSTELIRRTPKKKMMELFTSGKISAGQFVNDLTKVPELSYINFFNKNAPTIVKDKTERRKGE